MEEILKQNKSASHKEFEKLLSQDLGNRKLKEGEIITGTVSKIGKKFIYERLVQAEAFEKYLDRKFIGTKRYGLEGGEAAIPGLEQIVKQACLAGIKEIELGTAHRGRLTILATLFDVSYWVLFNNKN